MEQVGSPGLEDRCPEIVGAHSQLPHLGRWSVLHAATGGGGLRVLPKTQPLLSGRARKLKLHSFMEAQRRTKGIRGGARAGVITPCPETSICELSAS